MKRLLKIILPLIGKGGLLKYSFLGILSGLCNFLFIRAVTRMIDLVVTGNVTSVSKENVIIFSSIILVFIWIRRILSLSIIKLSQTLFWRLRMQILSQLLKANYQQLSSRRVRVRSTMLSDVYVLTEASLNIIQFFTASILTASCLIYLSSISLVLFLITLCVAIVGVTVYHFGTIKNFRNFRKARELENKFQEKFYSILDGFKEIYLEPKKGNFLFDKKITPISHDAYNNSTAAYTGFLNNQITGQILFYILISSVLLYFGFALKIRPSDIVSFVFTLLYLVGSIETIMILLPGLMRARVASDHLMDLKGELEEANFHNPVPGRYILKNEFSQIEIRGLEFYYGDHDKTFGIGPINFDVRKGEVVFIYGGNGSGKTTLVYSILGLCYPSGGTIRLNDTSINETNYADYRTAFSVVFNDFYLFNELIGVDDFDIDKWEYYIRLFELENKVTLEGKCFSTTDLSTGQRKRLALIAALMEEKPILVIDEWAADQDPYFRKKFYTQIIPLLKQDSFTIIAITHDDKYYYCADRLYKMDYGKLLPQSMDVHERPVKAL